MMKVEIRNARVKVTARFKNEGSVLRETIDAQGVGFETKLDVESRRAPEAGGGGGPQLGEGLLRDADDSQADPGGNPG